MRHSIIQAEGLYSRTGQRKFVNAPERANFLAVANAASLRDRALCLTLFYTGCRVSEALALTIGSLNPADGFIVFTCLKRRRTIFREVPAPPILFEAIFAMLEMDGVSNPDKRLWQITRNRAWQIVKAVMAMAGIGPGPHACPKGLRHGLGRTAIAASIPLNILQRWLGHASIKTTCRYADVMSEEERMLMARTWT